AICQPGMPPTTTVRTTVAGAGAGLTPEPPPTGITVVDAEALLAKPRPMAPALASMTPSRRRILIVRMSTFPSPGCHPGQTAALLTLRRYGPGTFFRIGTIPQIRGPGSLDFTAGGRPVTASTADWPERTLRPLWPAQPSKELSAAS